VDWGEMLFPDDPVSQERRKRACLLMIGASLCCLFLFRQIL